MAAARRRTLGYMLAGLVGAAALVGGCGSEEPGSGGADESTGRPAEIVVALGIRVGVLSSEDGASVRALAEDQVGVTRVAVSPDAETVYFTRSDPDVVCGQDLATQIVSVPFEGGDPRSSPAGRARW